MWDVFGGEAEGGGVGVPEGFGFGEGLGFDLEFGSEFVVGGKLWKGFFFGERKWPHQIIKRLLLE